MNDEDVVVFEEDGRTRSLHGMIVKEDADFISLKRRDGEFQIAKRFIVKVERRAACPHSFRHYDPGSGRWRCDRCGIDVDVSEV